MNSISIKALLIIATLTTASAFGKRPKKEKPPKQPRPALTQEQKQVIVANAAQVVGGICNIALDPHNPYNIGSSVGGMIQALINIIVEKFAHRKIDFDDTYVLQECLNELGKDISKEITEIIIKRNLLQKHYNHNN